MAELIIENGDCLELMKKLPDKSIDLFICDLPYGETNCKWDSVIDMEEFWKQFKRLRKSKHVACIHFCSTKFGYTLIKSWESGFKMDMVWKKRNKTGGLQSRHRPMRNHEMVYFFYEQAPKYNRDKYHKRIETKEEHNPEPVIEEDEDPNVNEDGKSAHGWDIKHMNKPRVASFEPVLPTAIFESTKFFGKRHHQTEKPLDILEFFLKYWSDENDTILDPTMGSGSTGVACKKLNRKFIGYEMDEKIFEIAKKRLE